MTYRERKRAYSLFLSTRYAISLRVARFERPCFYQFLDTCKSVSTGTFLIARVTPESRWIALCTDPYDLKFDIFINRLFLIHSTILRKKFHSFLIFPQLFCFLNFYPSPNFPTISNTSSGCLFSAFGSSLKVGLKFQHFFFQIIIFPTKNLSLRKGSPLQGFSTFSKKSKIVCTF